MLFMYTNIIFNYINYIFDIYLYFINEFNYIKYFQNNKIIYFLISSKF